VEVVEVLRPNRQTRRRKGKSDATDAEAAARAVLSGEACGAAKVANGTVEAIRARRVARRGAMKASTQASNQLRDLVLTAPDALRAKLAPLATQARVEMAARFRPDGSVETVDVMKEAMRSVALRHKTLSEEIALLDKRLGVLVKLAAPEGFLDTRGVGPQVACALLVTVGDNPGRIRSEASFAALCGASPVDASSGLQVRHRLNRGGDRQANAALWYIAFTRMRSDSRTQVLCRQAPVGGQDRQGDHALPQALHRPRALQEPRRRPLRRALEQGERRENRGRSVTQRDIGAS
jgi:transposase